MVGLRGAQESAGCLGPTNVLIRHWTLVNAIEKYQLPTGVGTGQLPVGRSFRQARFGMKTIECPLVWSKGDTLMVNHGLIAFANNYV